MIVETVEDSKFRKIELYIYYTPGSSGNWLNEDIPAEYKLKEANLILNNGPRRNIIKYLTQEGQMELLSAAVLQYEAKN